MVDNNPSEVEEQFGNTTFDELQEEIGGEKDKSEKNLHGVGHILFSFRAKREQKEQIRQEKERKQAEEKRQKELELAKKKELEKRIAEEEMTYRENAFSKKNDFEKLTFEKLEKSGFSSIYEQSKTPEGSIVTFAAETGFSIKKTVQSAHIYKVESIFSVKKDAGYSTVYINFIHWFDDGIKDCGSYVERRPSKNIFLGFVVDDDNNVVRVRDELNRFEQSGFTKLYHIASSNLQRIATEKKFESVEHNIQSVEQGE